MSERDPVDSGFSHRICLFVVIYFGFVLLYFRQCPIIVLLFLIFRKSMCFDD